MPFSGLGAGTAGDPYQVATAGQLNEVRDYLSAYFIQTADIDLRDYQTGEGWEPIGEYGVTLFSGSYNGQGFTITGLVINRDNKFTQGLFGDCNGAIFANVNIDGAYIIGNFFHFGALAGALAGGSITNCSATNVNIICNGQGAGGLVGGIGTGTIVNRCFTTGIVQGGGGILGGFIGQIDSFSQVTDCYTRCSVISGSIWCGGFVGLTGEGIVITNCYSTGIATESSSPSKGFANYVYNGVFTNCYWDKESSGCPTSNGGTGRTTAEMKYPSSIEYTNWDFATIWRLDKVGFNNNYPMLRWQEYPIPVYEVDRQYTVKMSMSFFKYQKNNYFDAVNIKCRVVSEDIVED